MLFKANFHGYGYILWLKFNFMLVFKVKF